MGQTGFCSEQRRMNRVPACGLGKRILGNGEVYRGETVGDGEETMSKVDSELTLK